MITKEYLQTIFKYDGHHLLWNSPAKGRRKSGVVGTLRKNGYIKVKLDGDFFYEHRLIFMMHHGFMPDYIDHINRIRNDNRIENLRSATLSNNCENSSLRCDNHLKTRGVSKTPAGKYRAYISKNKKRIVLGTFDNLDDAKAARIKASIHYYGEFSNEQV